MDALLLTPLQPISGSIQDPQFRSTTGGHLWVPLLQATQRVQEEIGRPLAFGNSEVGPVFGTTEFRAPRHRSASSIVLLSGLERAGLTWGAIDPGAQELGYWRTKLAEYAPKNPRVVGISTTFITARDWIANLLQMVRETFPRATILVGGYYYASNPKDFLSLDADVLVVGEGEVRFTQLVKRIRDRQSLDDIKGLYIRQPDRSLRFTGQQEPLELSELPQVDWHLASRIDPFIDIRRETIEYNVETQRGCVFKCEFCTYRTLAQLEIASAEYAVETIFNTAQSDLGYINMVDATATYPHTRWQKLLELLIARGGAPHPIGHFARVSDLSEHTAQLMAKANIKEVLIGQESGDQRILNAMRKGTHVSQVKPAINALAKNGLGAFLSFIHGFPGEDEQSCENTRRLLTTINDGFEDRPPVLFYKVDPLGLLKLSSLSQREEMSKVDHWLAYDSGGMTAKQAAGHAVETFVRISKVPSAPVNYHMLVLSGGPVTSAIYVAGNPHKYALHRWLKSVERLTAIFMDRELRSTNPDRHEVAALKKKILAAYPRPQRSPLPWVKAKVKGRVLGQLLREWTQESDRGPGRLTRVMTAGMTLRELHDPMLAQQAWGRGALPERGVAPDSPEVDAMAGLIADTSLENAKGSTKRLRVLTERQLQADAARAAVDPVVAAAMPPDPVLYR